MIILLLIQYTLAVWYNAIYGKYDEYYKGDYSDFNNALKAFNSTITTSSAQTKLKKSNETIYNSYTNLKNVPTNQIAL